MKLGDILDRAYDVLGDTKGNPQHFERQGLVDLINEGCLVFRRFVEDKWFRYTQDLVASQAVYTFPDTAILAKRVAYEDCTLRPATMQELRGIDERWETRSQTRPTLWITQGQAHNKYRLYPKPDTSTPDSFDVIADPNVADWDADHGIIGRWVDGSGANVAFAADPNVVGWSAEHGEIGRADSLTFSSESGELAQVKQTGAGNLTVWFVQLPSTVSADGDEIPIKNSFQIACLWYTLWHTYEKESDHHNSVLAAYYRDEFKQVVEEARELVSMPFPFQKHILGNDAVSPYDLTRILPFDNQGLDDTGSPMTLGWPRWGI